MEEPYQHALDRRSVSGARTALSLIWKGGRPQSLLDVGCGTGTWMRAALDLGVPRVVGVDAYPASDDQLLVDTSQIRRVDLRADWDLGQTFDAVLCLEVAEHVPAENAEHLIRSLSRHGDHIWFSAAVPGQGGQGHVNEQWPAYWQALFNRVGFVCLDVVRWILWDCQEIEPWYRQNLFLAKRNPAEAGSEPRIPAVIHPDMLRPMFEWARQSERSLLQVWVERLTNALRGKR